MLTAIGVFFIFRIRLCVSIASSTVLNVLSSSPSQRPVSRKRDWRKKPQRRTSRQQVQSLLNELLFLNQTSNQSAMSMFSVCISYISYPSFPFSTLHDGLGPTSPAHLLHSQATINSRIYETYDQRYQHTFEVSKSGDGLIQVQKPANDDQRHTRSKPLDLHVERDVMENLLNAYFADIAPMLPVITESEFLATPNPPAILMYSMCLVAAARRDVPQKIFDSIRHMVNTIIKEEDVLSTASFTNLQAILILCMTTDCHSQFVPTALSVLWIRLGAAIRMVGLCSCHSFSL